MIEKLTPEQEKYLPKFRQKYLDIGLDTSPIDDDKCRKSVRNLYKAAGEKEPSVLIFDSPYACLIARGLVIKLNTDIPQLGSQLDSQLYTQLDSQLRSQLYTQLESQLNSQLDSQLRSQLYTQLESQLRSQLYTQLYTQLESQLNSQLDSQLYSQLGSQLESQLNSQLYSQLDSQLYSQLRSQLHSQLYTQLYSQLGSQLGSQLYTQLGSQLNSQLGSQLNSQLRSQLSSQDLYALSWITGGMDAFWLAFYEFGREIGVRYDNQSHLDAYVDFSKNCGWMYAYEGFAFVSKRPTEIHFSKSKVLHNIKGMSVKYPDGWGIYSYEGVSIPGEWIESPEILTAEIALTCENTEQRNAACEILGWDKILDTLDAKTIDKDVDPLVGELVEVDLPDSGLEKFLRIRCGTGRDMALWVPKEMTTALQANLNSYGMPADRALLPEIRT